MSKESSYRYAKSKGEYEKDLNLHIREMIEMMKNEEVEETLCVKKVCLSKHSFARMQQHFGVKDIASATQKAREMLKCAVRIGSVLAFDGRINVLYAFKRTAFFMSPDLETLVTVNRFENVSYKQFLGKENDREKLIGMHRKLLEEIEQQEDHQVKLILSLEQKVREATELCAGMLTLVRGRGRKSGLKEIISQQNLELKKAGRKLFNLKIEKRHVCKSLVSLY